jgi:drug/metabolite transporter (DMT)-like permease
MTPWRATLRGMAAMSLSIAAFTFNDALMKLAGLPAGETMAIRSLLAGPVLACIIVARGLVPQLRLLFGSAVVARTAGDVAATILYLVALFQIPLSTALTIAQVAPLAITAAAALFLGEHVGWRRWSAVATGFVGVLIVMRPGLSGFQAASLLTLLSVAGVAVRDLATRAMPPLLSGLVVTFAAAVANGIAGLGMGLVETWVVPSPTAFAEIVGAATSLSLGHIGVIVAMRNGDMSAIAPFRYVGIPLAIALGFVIWGDVPDLVTLAGTGLIILAGGYTLIRERRLAQEGADVVRVPLAQPNETL